MRRIWLATCSQRGTCSRFFYWFFCFCFYFILPLGSLLSFSSLFSLRLLFLVEDYSSGCQNSAAQKHRPPGSSEWNLENFWREITDSAWHLLQLSAGARTLLFRPTGRILVSTLRCKFASMDNCSSCKKYARRKREGEAMSSAVILLLQILLAMS